MPMQTHALPLQTHALPMQTHALPPPPTWQRLLFLTTMPVPRPPPPPPPAVPQVYDRYGQGTLTSQVFAAWFAENSHWLRPYAAFCFLRDIFQVGEPGGGCRGCVGVGG